VAQILSGDGSDAPATEVITVADLLSRHAPVPVQRQEPDTGGISVGALLRREGRAPHSDRLQLRPQQQAPASDEGRTDRRILVRRGAIAAGTLLAAGSVLGAAMLADVAPTANQGPATGGAEDDGPYAGQGLLDPEAPIAAPQDSVVIDQAAARDPLDPGTAAPSNWVPVAFPGALPGDNDGGDPPANGASGDSSGDESSRAAATTGDDDDDDDEPAEKSTSDSSESSSSSDSSRSSSASVSSSSKDSGDNSDEEKSDDRQGRGLVGGLLDTVGDVLDGDDSEKNDGDDEDRKSSRSMSLFSADDDEDEDSSAPRDEDDSESRSSAESSDSDDSEDRDSDDGGDSDDDGDRGLVRSVTGTVGSLLG
jgi:hypothetical protein